MMCDDWCSDFKQPQEKKITSQGQQITCSFYFGKGKIEEIELKKRSPGMVTEPSRGDLTKKVTGSIWDPFRGL